ncbi:hypothetical protein [Salinicoccus sp. ID82-1]|nr:hypothetical protein [Salinicoccus sp. ID82-1]
MRKYSGGFKLEIVGGDGKFMKRTQGRRLKAHSSFIIFSASVN